MFCPKKCHDHLILGRRYALTSTAYKHLEVYISASYVTIIVVRITDNRNNRISMSHTTWAAIMEHRPNIEQLVQSTPEAIPREIHDLIYNWNCKNTKQKYGKIHIVWYFYIHEAFNCTFFCWILNNVLRMRFARYGRLYLKLKQNLKSLWLLYAKFVLIINVMR